MQTLNDHPVGVAGLVLTLASAVLAALAYYLKMTPEEVLLWGGILSAAVGVISWWISTRTQPDSKPVDRSDGVPLVRADTLLPSTRARAAGREVVKGAAIPRGAGEAASTVAMRWNK